MDKALACAERFQCKASRLQPPINSALQVAKGNDPATLRRAGAAYPRGRS
jgi:hypothetical protein